MKKLYLLLLIVACSMLFLSSFVYATPYAYVGNWDSQNISVVNINDNIVVDLIPAEEGELFWGTLAIDKSKNRLYVGNVGTISVYDYALKIFVGKITLSGDGHVNKISINKDGSKLFVPMYKTYHPEEIDRVEVVDAETLSVEKVISLEGYGSGGSYGTLSPDGSRFYLPCRWTDNIVVIDVNQYTVVDVVSIAAGDLPFSASLTSDGKKMYVPTRAYGGYINIVDVDPASSTYHQVLKTVRSGDFSTGDITRSVLSPDETRLYIPFPEADKLVVLDTQIDEIYTVLDTVEYPTNLMVLPDGEYIYLASAVNGSLDVLSADSLTSVQTVYVGDFPYDVVYVDIPNSPVEVVTEIEDMLSSGEITNEGTANSLIQSLSNAQDKLETSPVTCKNILKSMINAIEAQAGKDISTEAAEILISQLNAVIATL